MNNVLFISNHDKLPSEDYGFSHHLYQIDEFIKRGYNVTYIVPSFNHFTKSQRVFSSAYLNIDPSFKIKVLPTPAYSSNLSFKRFYSYFVFAIRVFFYGWKNKDFQILFLVLPSPFVDFVCFILKKRMKAKLIVDLRDLWPELFEKYLKGLKYVLAWPIIKILFFARNMVFKEADIITAVSKKYLKIATKSNDVALSGVVNLGFDDQYEIYSANLSVSGSDDRLNIIYAGSLSHNYDINCLVKVIQEVIDKHSDKNIVFHIAGDGKFKQLFLKLQKESSTKIKFYGNLKKQELYDLYRKMHVSLCIYDKDTLISFPAKLFELIFYHLPIINSLEGEVAELISDENIGLNYKSGDEISLLNAILFFYGNRDILEKSKKNMVKIKSRFSAQNQYAKFGRLINNLN